MKRHRALSAIAAGACALLFVASCGQPSPVRTLEGEPDLVKIANNEIPPGFSADAVADLRRLRSACAAIFAITGPAPAVVRAELPSLQLFDGQCEWRGVDTGGPSAAPALVVGLLASRAGGARLDQTEAVLTGEHGIANVGDRATLDPQTRTLYVLRSDRLWYVQLLQPRADTDVASTLAKLGRALAAAPAAR